MATVIVLTRKWSSVHHLGFWAYDRQSKHDLWSTGRYVPLCGQERNHDEKWTATDHAGDDGQPRLEFDTPMCSRCQTLAVALAELATTERNRP